MTPIEKLVHEHKIILSVLDSMEREVRSIRTTGTVHGDIVRQMVDFFRSFADRCHHAKEEKHLFRMMNERGFPYESGPLAVMLHEHDEGRLHVAEIERLIEKAGEGDAVALDSLAGAMTDYAALLRSHIGKEDNVLYPMAGNLLSDADMAELGGIFEKVEAEEIGEGVHEKYHALAHRLAG